MGGRLLGLAETGQFPQPDDSRFAPQNVCQNMCQMCVRIFHNPTVLDSHRPLHTLHRHCSTKVHCALFNCPTSKSDCNDV